MTTVRLTPRGFVFAHLRVKGPRSRECLIDDATSLGWEARSIEDALSILLQRGEVVDEDGVLRSVRLLAAPMN